MHALMIRATLMAMLLLSLSVALIHVQVQGKPETPQCVACQTTTAASPAVASPASARPIVLPTVHVRITPAEMARIGRESVEHATATPADFPESGHTAPSIYHALAPALHRARLDMPYYSFGKTLSAGKD